jgi:homoserine dehydrogenase
MSSGTIALNDANGGANAIEIFSQLSGALIVNGNGLGGDDTADSIVMLTGQST